MSEPEVRKELLGSKARFVIDTPEGQAELTLSIASPRLVIADHTEVPKELEGRGYARALLDALIADARAEGYKIMPLCPYVNGQRKRHPEWADLFSV